MSARTLQHTSASDSFSEGREFHSALENHHARREERHTSAGIRMQGEMSELGNLLEGRSNDRRTHPCPPVVIFGARLNRAMRTSLRRRWQPIITSDLAHQYILKPHRIGAAFEAEMFFAIGKRRG